MNQFNNLPESGALREAFLSKAVEPASTSARCKTSAVASETVSLRVTPEEKDRLMRDAAGLSLSAYLRERFLGVKVNPRRTRGKFPVKDHAKLAAVLSALGRSNLSRDLEALEWAVRDGTVHLSPESEEAFRAACADVSAMRRDLLAALGLTAKRGDAASAGTPEG